jgi:hypothetical protein
MGRCVKTLSDAPKAEVETLAAVLTAEQVAGSFGIGRRTFYSMMAHDEEIAARHKRGKAKAIGVIAQGLINKARGGDTASMIFFLKTQAGWREAEEPGAVERLRTFLDVIAQRHNVAATLIARPLADGGVELSVDDSIAPDAGNPP